MKYFLFLDAPFTIKRNNYDKLKETGNYKPFQTRIFIHHYCALSVFNTFFSMGLTLRNARRIIINADFK